MGRRTKTLIPTTEYLLSPKTIKSTIVQEEKKQRITQKHHYDKHAKSLKEFNIGDNVSIQETISGSRQSSQPLQEHHVRILSQHLMGRHTEEIGGISLRLETHQNNQHTLMMKVVKMEITWTLKTPQTRKQFLVMNQHGPKREMGRKEKFAA